MLYRPILPPRASDIGYLANEPTMTSPVSSRLRAAPVRVVVLVAIVTALSTMVAVSPASAHDPIFVEADQTTPDVGPYMPDGAISWALYGSVLDVGDTRGFEFDLRDGEELYISLLIPNLEPELSLTDDELPVIELEAPDGTTRTITNDMREQFDEPFSNTSYITLSEVREPAQAGRYKGLVIGAAASRFTVAIGEREEFFTPAERTGDRPSSFPGIAAPLQAWYSTPPGEEVATDLAEGDAEIQMDMIEEAMESGEGSAPEGALGDGTGDGSDSADGGSLGWVAPVVALAAVAVGAGWVRGPPASPNRPSGRLTDESEVGSSSQQSLQCFLTDDPRLPGLGSHHRATVPLRLRHRIGH